MSRRGGSDTTESNPGRVRGVQKRGIVNTINEEASCSYQDHDCVDQQCELMPYRWLQQRLERSVITVVTAQQRNIGLCRCAECARAMRAVCVVPCVVYLFEIGQDHGGEKQCDSGEGVVRASVDIGQREESIGNPKRYEGTRRPSPATSTSSHARPTPQSARWLAGATTLLTEGRHGGDHSGGYRTA